jgi:hypothetical protein
LLRGVRCPLWGRLLLSLALCAVVFALGCGRGGSKDVVTGSVTLNGQGVDGTIVFVGSDGKEVNGPLLNGKYQINNPPKGEVDVLVKGAPGARTAAVQPKSAPPMPDGGKAAPAGIAPPFKYAQRGNGLKFKVTGGRQEKNFELTP